MKKKIVVFVAVLVLILSSAGTVFAADVFSDVAKLQPLCISVSAYVRLCPSFNF